MTIYILSGTPCAVKLDGKYVGRASENYKILETDGGFLEFEPLDSSYSSVCIIIGKEPKGTKDARVFDIFGGFLIIPTFPRRLVTDYREIGSGKLETSAGTALFKVVSENGIKLSLSLNGYDVKENSPFAVEEAKFTRVAGGRKEYAVAFLTGGRTLVVGFDVSLGKPTVAFRNACDGYDFEKGNLVVYEKKNDVLGHTVESVWNFADTVSCVRYSVKSDRRRYSVPEKLIPLAFFEEIALDGDLAPFLSPKLYGRRDELADFLGKFTAVLPPPHFAPENTVLLLYRDKIQYAETVVEKGLITEIRLLDKSDF